MEKLYEGEYRLMQVLWESGEVSSAQLVILCGEKLGWNKSTTYTVLRKLKNKGAVRHERSMVAPILTREEAVRERGRELEQWAGGLDRFMTAFMSGRKLTREEADRLKELIDRQMKEE